MDIPYNMRSPNEKASHIRHPGDVMNRYVGWTLETFKEYLKLLNRLYDITWFGLVYA